MYRLTDDPAKVVFLPQNALVTLPAAESYGFAYEAWVAAGNLPLPAEEAVRGADEILAWLRQECDRRLAALRQGYPDSEVLSWDKQEAEARAGGGPLVYALAAARGLDEQELIRRILAKADAFAVLSGTIIGQRQALEDQVRAGVLEVEWPE